MSALIGTLVYAYFWHHFTVKDGDYLAAKDDRKGWFLRLCEKRALLFRRLETRAKDDGSEITIAIVFNPELDREIEVDPNLIKSDGIGVGDLCRLKMEPSRLFKVVDIIHETLTWHETAHLTDVNNNLPAYWYTKQLQREATT